MARREKVTFKTRNREVTFLVRRKPTPKPKPLMVSLEVLEKWCKENKFGFRPPRVNINELILWAKKEARK